MLQKTFIASSITVCKPLNASLAMTHKTYCTISHGSCGKRRKKTPVSVFEPSPCFDLRRQFHFVCVCVCETIVSWCHVTVMCPSLNSEGRVKTLTVKQSLKRSWWQLHLQFFFLTLQSSNTRVLDLL